MSALSVKNNNNAVLIRISALSAGWYSMFYMALHREGCLTGVGANLNFCKHLAGLKRKHKLTTTSCGSKIIRWP